MNRSLLSLFAFLACLVVLSLWLAGCESVTATQALNRQVQGKNVKRSIVQWDDVNQTDCDGEIAGLLGCAKVSFLENGELSICTVSLPKTSPDWLIAHELKHCFGWIDNR